jgi:FtsP/CotA-like multicopper oxidase with cupredoxin domain
MPLALYDRKHPVQIASHFLLPPAGRLEAIVTGPPQGAHRVLRTLCVDSGPAGDPNPEMILADLVTGHTHAVAATRVTVNTGAPPAENMDLEARKKSPPDFVVTFSEDKNGFYINGKKYSPDANPMTRAKVGTLQHWRIVNATTELHPFHIHQVHFLAYAVNGVRMAIPEWLDTVNVPYGGTVDVILDFTNPLIRGTSLFHCHLLNHEDKGMMAKIAIE